LGAPVHPVVLMLTIVLCMRWCCLLTVVLCMRWCCLLSVVLCMRWCCCLLLPSATLSKHIPKERAAHYFKRTQAPLLRNQIPELRHYMDAFCMLLCQR
jgi:hypothetical protein